jgi:hypothetical protein
MSVMGKAHLSVNRSEFLKSSPDLETTVTHTSKSLSNSKRRSLVFAIIPLWLNSCKAEDESAFEDKHAANEDGQFQEATNH